MTLLEQQKAKKLKRFLMKVKESEKAGLKFNIQKTKIIAYSHHLAVILKPKKIQFVSFLLFPHLFAVK